MKSIRIITLVLIGGLVKICFGQNIVPNGDFENGFDSWITVENVSLSNTVVQSGNQSFKADDTSKLQYSYVYQELALKYAKHEITFWVYPASATYLNAFELIADWNVGAKFITRVLMRDSTLEFTAFDAQQTIPNVLAANAWNQFKIQVDSSTFQQDFYINGSLVSSLTASAFPAIEHLLVGDLSAANMYGTIYYDAISISDTFTTAIAQTAVPTAKFTLQQNYPNPFNPETTIQYSIPKQSHMTLEVFNISGQHVATLVNEVVAEGVHSTRWQGKDDAGIIVPSGVYVYKLQNLGYVKAKKFLLVK
ncbi:MAG: T9SS C-terminal target domain-containing protein [Calditrichaeota bacterium]|nr:MAG: T9SS C-terminal target domain-containing protein [Calditrichota bacterium]